MRIFIALVFTTIVLYNCTEKTPNIRSEKSGSETKDSLSLIIDSIKLANLHKSFVGRHNHGLATGKKDLAEHAHQNPAKKRRWRKKQFAGVKSKKAAIKRINRENAMRRGDSTFKSN